MSTSKRHSANKAKVNRTGLYKLQDALTEVLASIVMGYLLLLDSFRDARYLKSSQYFVRESIGQVTRHIAALENC